MPDASDKNAAQANSVSTEPQRLALESMSRDLLQKLNDMVAEQEKRAHEFAARQHSLSSLPADTHPQLPKPPIPAAPVLPQIPTYSQAPTYTQPSPHLPPVPRSNPPPRQGKTQPPYYAPDKQNKKEEGVGVGTVLTIVLIFFFIVLKGC